MADVPMGEAGEPGAAMPPAWAERFRAAFDGAPVGMALLAADGRVLRANRALVALLERDPAGLRGAPFLDLVHPADAGAALPAAWLLAAGEVADCRVELRLARGGGGPLWAVLSLSLLRDARGRAAGFVAHVQDATELRAQEARLRHRALHDPLTGLPNRALLVDRLARALEVAGRRDDAGVAVLLLDLDGFKGVNDDLGHHAGDRLLAAVGERLRACLRAGDTAARFGGDEFALLLEGTRSVLDATAVADRVLAALSAPVPLEGREATVSASIGIALGRPGQARPTHLLRAADAALYRAKAAGGGWAVGEEGQAEAAASPRPETTELELLRGTAWLRSPAVPEPAA
jgi:diguanylate cyclase (GGDEF)-like protein/PAS domain S-box-containing protein